MLADNSDVLTDGDAEANDILREIAAIGHSYGLTINAEKRKALTADGSPCELYLDNS